MRWICFDSGITLTFQYDITRFVCLQLLLLYDVGKEIPQAYFLFCHSKMLTSFHTHGENTLDQTGKF